MSLLKNQANAESSTKDDPRVGESRSNAPNVGDEDLVETKGNTSSPHRRKHSTSLEAMNTDFLSYLTQATTESSSPKNAKPITAETSEGNVNPNVVVADTTIETGAKRDGSSSHRQKNSSSLEEMNSDSSPWSNQATTESSSPKDAVPRPVAETTERDDGPNAGAADEAETGAKGKKSSSHRRKNSSSLEAMNNNFSFWPTEAIMESSSPKDAKPRPAADTLEGNNASDVDTKEVIKTGKTEKKSSFHRRKKSSSLEEPSSDFSSGPTQATSDSSSPGDETPRPAVESSRENDENNKANGTKSDSDSQEMNSDFSPWSTQATTMEPAAVDDAKPRLGHETPSESVPQSERDEKGELGWRDDRSLEEMNSDFLSLLSGNTNANTSTRSCSSDDDDGLETVGVVARPLVGGSWRRRTGTLGANGGLATIDEDDDSTGRPLLRSQRD